MRCASTIPRQIDRFRGASSKSVPSSLFNRSGQPCPPIPARNKACWRTEKQRPTGDAGRGPASPACAVQRKPRAVRFRNGPTVPWLAELRAPCTTPLQFRGARKTAGSALSKKRYNPQRHYQSDRRRVFPREQLTPLASSVSERIMLMRYYKRHVLRRSMPRLGRYHCLPVPARQQPSVCGTGKGPQDVLRRLLLQSPSPYVLGSLPRRLTAVTLATTLLSMVEDIEDPLQRYHLSCYVWRPSAGAHLPTAASPDGGTPEYSHTTYGRICLVRALLDPQCNLFDLQPYHRLALWIYCFFSSSSLDQQLANVLEQVIFKQDTRFDVPCSYSQLVSLLAMVALRKDSTRRGFESRGLEKAAPQGPVQLLHSAAARLYHTISGCDALPLFALCVETDCSPSVLTALADHLANQLETDMQTCQPRIQLSQMPKGLPLLPPETTTFDISPKSNVLAPWSRETQLIVESTARPMDCLAALVAMEKTQHWYSNLARSILNILHRQCTHHTLNNALMLRLAITAGRLPELHAPFLVQVLRHLACSTLLQPNSTLNDGLQLLQQILMDRPSVPGPARPSLNKPQQCRVLPPSTAVNRHETKKTA